MGDQISGLHPTLVIFIVNLHQTISGWDDSSAMIKGSSLHFTGSGKRSDNTHGTFGSQRAKIQLDTGIGSTGALAMGKVKADKTAYGPDEAGRLTLALSLVLFHVLFLILSLRIQISRVI
jgi:hypothetical protein